jgi:hypothetical protein
VPIPDTLIASLKGQSLGPSISVSLPTRSWSRSEWDRIKVGHLAGDMDDKWLAFVEGDPLYLRRSWTRDRMYEAQFEADRDVRTITEALVRKDDRYHPMSSVGESMQLEVIIETVLLNEWNQVKIDQLLEIARQVGVAMTA